MMQKAGNFLKKHRKVIALCAAILLVIIVAVNLYLFVKFLLGSDIVITLSADKETLVLQRGESAEISFNSEISANPFCKVICSYDFVSLSRNSTIDSDSTSMTEMTPIKKKYTITAESFGSGQELYLFNIDCVGIDKFMCRTRKEATEKSFLLTVEYQPSKKDLILKNKSVEAIDSFLNILKHMNQQNTVVESYSSAFKNTGIFDDLEQTFNETKKQIQLTAEKMVLLETEWKTQNYSEIYGSTELSNPFFKTAADIAEKAKDSAEKRFLIYEDLRTELDKTRNSFLFFSNKSILLINASKISEADSAINEFNRLNAVLESKSNFTDKYAAVSPILSNLNKKTGSIIKSNEQETALKLAEAELSIALNYDVFYEITGRNITHKSIDELNESVKLAETCAELNESINYFSNITAAELNSFLLQNHSNKDELMMNNSIKIRETKKNLLVQYNNSISKNSRLNQFIEAYPVEETVYNNISKDNLSAMIPELLSFKQELCNVSYELSNVNNISLPKIDVIPKQQEYFEFDFAEINPSCCFMEDCSACCNDLSCENNSSYYPIIFIHGHNINENVPTDNSWYAFTKIQNKLAEDGYVDGGVINLYSSKDSSSSWNLINKPVSMQISYYLEVIDEKNRVTFIRSKDEGIDVYATRLNDMVNLVKKKTGKSKVVIIAHSMGGLVSRRYLQMFGSDDVDKVILIAVPNHGLSERIYQICLITGEKRECEDMLKNSDFLKKLNQGDFPLITIHNLVGVGCEMESDTGDGLVLRDSAVLDGAQNYFISGSCSGLEIMHGDITDVDKHPETYDIILSVLKEK